MTEWHSCPLHFAFSALRFERRGLVPAILSDIAGRPENSNGINPSAFPLQHERTRLADANMNLSEIFGFSLFPRHVHDLVCVWLCNLSPGFMPTCQS
jgi:hypothetical protein